MKPNLARVTLTLLIAVPFSVIAPHCVAATPEGVIPSIGELPAACRAAKAAFRPLSQKDVQQARDELIRAVDRLDRRLKTDRLSGANWRKYVEFDKLRAQLQPDSEPEADALDKIHRKFAADHEGLDLVWFLDVRDAIGRYKFITGLVGDTGLQTAFGNLLDGLADQLQTCAAEPTAEEALAIGQAVGQLSDARQVPALVAAIRHHFARPNLFMQASADLISAGIAEEVDETAPVRDVILGTNVRGTGHTLGSTTAKLIPNRHRGVVDTIFLGTTTTKSVGTNGPMRVYSDGTTRIGAVKRLWVNADGLHTLPAAANATTETKYTGMQASGRLVQRIGSNQAYRQKSQSERVAARHAEQRVCRQIDEQAAEMIDHTNDNYMRKLHRPLVEHGLFPQQCDVSTTTNALELVAMRADGSQLASPGPPPDLPDDPDLAMRLHQSMIDNMAAGALGGKTVPDEQFEALMIEWLGELPENLQRDEGGDPWKISFASRQPVTVAFADNGLTVTIRGRRFHVGGDSHPGMNVTAVYKIAETQQGFKAVRDGDLEIYPPGFVPGSGRRLNTRQMVIRTMLDRRFSRIFEKEILIEDMEPTGNWAKLGKLRPVRFTCEDGWMTMVWKRIP